MTLLVRRGVAADMPQAFALRHTVFVLGQGVPQELERDGSDDDCEHVVAVRAGVVVGTGRLGPGEPAAIGRMAVAPAERGRGTGAALLAALEQLARERGAATAALHAQVHARRFYERAGWCACGEVFREAGIDHVAMTKRLAGTG